MPKRIVDGPGVWKSVKLAQVQPVAFRAEFANLIPLATANGTFECNPQLILHEVYGFNRPDMTLKKITALLSEFGRVKLLFRWTEPSGKVWGYWVGIDKKGRLPSKKRQEEKHEMTGPDVPQHLLDKFLSDNDLLPGNQQGTEQGANGSLLGDQWLHGTGLGTGFGSGTGEGEETGTARQRLQKQPQNQNPPSLSCTENGQTLGQDVESDALWIETQVADLPASTPSAVFLPKLREMIREDLRAGRTKHQILSAIKEIVGSVEYFNDRQRGLHLVQNYPIKILVVAEKRPQDHAHMNEIMRRVIEGEQVRAKRELEEERERESTELELIEETLPEG